MKDIFIVSAPTSSGKSAFMRDIAERLTSSGESVTGFLSPKVYLEKEFIGYNLKVIGSDQSHVFIRKGVIGSWEHFGRFSFNPDAFEIGSRIIRQSVKEDFLLIDELGPLEYEGKGFMPALQERMQSQRGTLIAVIRETLAEDFNDSVFENRGIIYLPEKWDELVNRI